MDSIHTENTQPMTTATPSETYNAPVPVSSTADTRKTPVKEGKTIRYGSIAAMILAVMIWGGYVYHANRELNSKTPVVTATTDAAVKAVDMTPPIDLGVRVDATVVQSTPDLSIPQTLVPPVHGVQDTKVVNTTTQVHKKTSHKQVKQSDTKTP